MSSPASSSTPGPRCVALVPVKGLDRAKSRLGPLGAARRRDLALAFAGDTVEAARSTPGIDEVVVVTSDPTVLELAATHGVATAADHGGLNRSLVQVGETLRRRDPRVRLLALCADLPAVGVEELQALLDCDAPTVAVADHHGTGTTALLCAGAWEPRFGPGSFAAHREGGAVDLDVAAPGLRCDVDSPADLAAARTLGLGRCTTRADARRSSGS